MLYYLIFSLILLQIKRLPAVMKKTILILVALFTLPMASTLKAADQGGIVTSIAKFVRKLGTTIDTMTVRGVDRNYIDAPELPWQVILRGGMSQTDLRFSSTMHAKDFGMSTGEHLTWEPRIKNSPTTYAGVWVGYRGYGIGLSRNFGNNKGSILTLGATGGSYGINMRIHSFEESTPMVHLGGFYYDRDSDDPGNPVTVSADNSFQLFSPIKVHTLTLDGYYFFNGKRFSYAAAYDQSVIQKRSAGSFMAGAMYHYSRVKYNDDYNADFILFMNDIGIIKQWQASIGAGYAYNYVPCKGLLISALAMPLVTFYNRTKVWLYDSDYKQQFFSDDFDETDLFLDRHINEYSTASRHSHVTLNFDARLSLTYQFDRFFFNAYGQFSRIPYKDAQVKGRFTDWYINASLGIRL